MVSIGLNVSMRHYLLPFYVALFIFISLSHSRAQQVDWVTIMDEVTTTNNVDQYDNGDLLISGLIHVDYLGFLARIDTDGNVLWWKTIEHPDFFNGSLKAFLIEGDAIVLYDRKGGYIVMDPEGTEIIHRGVITLQEAGDLLRLKFQKRSEGLFIHGVLSTGSSGTIFFIVHDPISNVNIQENTLGHISDITWPVGVHLDQDLQGNTIVSYRQLSRQTTLFLDDELNIRWSEIDDYPHHTVYGIEFASDDHYYIWGNLTDTVNIPYPQTTYLRRHGVSDNVLDWEFQMIPAAGDNFAGISDIVLLEDGRVFFAGDFGYHRFSPMTDLHYGLVDDDGELIWRNERHISGYGETLIKALPSGDNAVVVAGQCNLLDHYPNANSFVMKIGEIQTSTTSMARLSALQLSPNPATNYLHLSLSLNKLPYEVFDTRGNRVMEGIHSGDAIDISSIPPGLYVIRLLSGREIFSQTFQKL